MKQIICDRCRKPITDKAYKILVGTIGSDKKFEKEFYEETSVQDYCESCIKKLIGIQSTTDSTLDGHKSKVDVEKMHALKTAGWSNTKIAEEFGVTPATIGYHLNKS